jgi:cell division inhibitor SepF
MTMYNQPLEPDEDEMEGAPHTGLRSRFGRWMDHLTGRVEDEETYEEQVAVQATRPAAPTTTARRDTFRVASAREGSITVMPVTSFADVQKAADRLKAGEPQIINLEKTPAEVAERLIDFLNGVTYALDGYVEKVSEGAYLFTPSFIAIQTDSPDAPQPKTIFDRL